MRIDDFSINWRNKDSYFFTNPKKNQIIENKIKKLLEKVSSLESFLWIPTSGTGGKLKYVGISKESFLISAKSVSEWAKIKPKDVILNTLPLFHVAGLSNLARSYVSGASYFDISKEIWTAGLFLKKLKNYKVTITSLVPTQLYDVLSLNIKPTKNLRLVFVGGGRLNYHQFKKARGLGWPIYPTYGMTEASSQVASTKALSDWVNEKEPLLEVLPHIQIKIDFKTKVLFLKSKSLATKYAEYTNDQWRLKDLVKKDQWYQSQDLVQYRKTDEGTSYLNILNRGDQNIKVLGELVNLDQLNKKLDQILEIHFPKSSGMFQVVSVKDLRKGSDLILIGELSQIFFGEKIFLKINDCFSGLEKLTAIFYIKKIKKTALGKRLSSQI